MLVRKRLGNWERTVVWPESKGFGKEYLHVYTPAHNPDWVRIARFYWEGRLPELSQTVSSPRNIVHRGRIPGDTETYYFKRYLMRNWKDPFKHVFRSSRARRELLGHQLLLSRGFNAPEAVCMIEACVLGVVRGSALITVGLDRTPTLQGILFPSNTAETPSRKGKHELLRALGREVGYFHASGLWHGDMHIKNVLCRQNADGYRFYWLDNERTRRTRALRARARNLNALNKKYPGLTRSDRMRFWRAYIGVAQYHVREQKKLLREVIKLTKQTWQRRGWL